MARGGAAHGRLGDRRRARRPDATLRALGPFDADAFLFYEDLDLCLRARAPACRPSSIPR